MTPSSEIYQLDKWVWTEHDFDVMGWHDSLIYAFKVDQDVYFDIDYIFKWVEPGNDHWFSFWVSPCTLIFERPDKFKFNLESTEFYNYIEIAEIHKQINQIGKTEFRIETLVGDIIIETENFKQIVRRSPTLQSGQQIIREERGEVSFAITCDKEFIETKEVTKIKQEHFLLRQKANIARQLQKELSDLFDKRMKKELDAKQYILKKRQLERQITEIKQELKANDLEYLADPLF